MFLSKINQPIILIYLLKLPTFDKLIRNKTSWTMNEPLFLSIKNIHTMPRNSIFNCMWKAKNMLLGWRSLWQCKTVDGKKNLQMIVFFQKYTSCKIIHKYRGGKSRIAPKMWPTISTTMLHDIWKNISNFEKPLNNRGG